MFQCHIQFSFRLFFESFHALRRKVNRKYTTHHYGPSWINRVELNIVAKLKHLMEIECLRGIGYQFLIESENLWFLFSLKFENGGTFAPAYTKNHFEHKFI